MSQEKSFDTRSFTWSRFKVFKESFRPQQTDSLQYHPHPTCRQYVLYTMSVVIRWHLTEIDASPQSCSLRLSGTTVNWRWSSWITQHVWVRACLVLHSTPRKGSLLLQFRTALYNILAMMHNRNDLKAQTQRSCNHKHAKVSRPWLDTANDSVFKLFSWYVWLSWDCAGNRRIYTLGLPIWEM